MADGFGFAGNAPAGGWEALLCKYVGETVTVFTSSGGQSGSGFTGVLLSVNNCFIRLLTRIGPPPGCSLGNACSNFNLGYGKGPSNICGITGGYGAGSNAPWPIIPANYNEAVTAGGWDGYPVYTVGSVTDIPIDAIVSFVHNAV